METLLYETESSEIQSVTVLRGAAPSSSPTYWGIGWKLHSSFKPGGCSSTFLRSSTKIGEKETWLHRSLTYLRIIGGVREPPHKILAPKFNPIKLSVQKILSRRNRSFLTGMYRSLSQQTHITGSSNHSQHQLCHPVRKYQRPKCMQEILKTTHFMASRCSTIRRFIHQARYGTDYPIFSEFKCPLKFHVTQLNICKIRQRKKCSPSDWFCYHPE